MTNELKTLKDLRLVGIQTMGISGFKNKDWVNRQELKAEAVKWAKIMKNIDNKEMRLEFFLKIFNLTSEDLKGEMGK